MAGFLFDQAYTLDYNFIMHIHFYSNIDNDFYNSISNFFEERGLHCTRALTLDNLSYDILIIDSELYNDDLHLISPFYINIQTDPECRGCDQKDHFSGFIDLTSNPLVIYSQINSVHSEILNLYSSMYDKMPVSIAITDVEGNIEGVNPKFEDLTGYKESEILGKNLNILRSKRSITDYKDMWDTITSGKVWQGEFVNKRKCGTYYTEFAVITPIKNIMGNISHYVGLKEDISDLKQTKRRLENTLGHLEQIVKKRTRSLRSAQALTLESMATLSEYRDNETGAHIKRTKEYVKFLMLKLKDEKNLSDDYIFKVYSSAPLHDIGKVAIPDSILLKPGKLTEEEFEIMKGHVNHGNEALLRVSEGKDDDSFLKYAKEITLFHHEKWDGSGYPYGLKGEDIPLSARVMALADVYDALRSERPYKKGMEHEKVVEIIKIESGKHFDPRLVEIFLDYHFEFDTIFIRSSENLFDIV